MFEIADSLFYLVRCNFHVGSFLYASSIVLESSLFVTTITGSFPTPGYFASQHLEDALAQIKYPALEKNPAWAISLLCLFWGNMRNVFPAPG